MEILIVYAILWKCGFKSNKEYNRFLDEMFLKNPQSTFLLELEECSSNCDVTYEKIDRFWNYEYHGFHIELFGETLFHCLEVIYTNNAFSIEEFGQRCHALWNCLPGQMGKMEPFFTLCYADDYLSWGEENQTRMLYEKTFAFYKVNGNQIQCL